MRIFIIDNRRNAYYIGFNDATKNRGCDMETLAQEKARMLRDFRYYQKPNGEIAAVMNTRNMSSFYGSSASFILSYMRKIHKCSLLPIREAV